MRTYIYIASTGVKENAISLLGSQQSDSSPTFLPVQYIMCCVCNVEDAYVHTYLRQLVINLRPAIESYQPN